MPFRASRGRRVVGYTCLVVLAGCSTDPSGAPEPADSDLEISIAGGNLQLASPLTQLPDPLQVQVRKVSTGKPAPEVGVQWIVEEGGGGKLSRNRSVTDSLGMTSTELTLGSTVGAYTVRATFDGLIGPDAVFEARAVATPVLLDVPAGPVLPGQTLTIRGQNFWPSAEENLVLFSGVRGRVASASAQELIVEVPPCLPSRSVQVTVSVGNAESLPKALAVAEGSAFVDLEPGQDRWIVEPEGFGCVRLQADGAGLYLGVVSSASIVGGGVYDYVLRGLAGAAAQVAPARPDVPAQRPRPGPTLPEPGQTGDPQRLWEEGLRRWEAELLPASVSETQAAAQAVPAPAPQVGDRREFNVLNRDREFEKVTAEVAWVGERGVVYQDVRAPAGGMTGADFEAVAAEFDDPIHWIVSGAFGDESDLDGNDRVVILFTPVVNELTPRGSDGFVGGFFFGLDLLTDRPGSNKAEVFYALVPDPEGAHGDPRAKSLVMDVVPAVLAHELQHMIHFNERVLVRGASGTEALWLSEGLAQMAEDLVGEIWDARNYPDKGLRYRYGNWLRAQRYLSSPSEVSLVIGTGSGTLEERGAGWLYVRYLYEHSGGLELLRSLTGTTRTGVGNVTTVTGYPWALQLAQWSAALFMDDLLVGTDPRLRYPEFRLRYELERLDGGYTLEPLVRGSGDFLHEGRVHSSSPAFFLLRVPGSGGMAVNLAGPCGGPEEPGSQLQLMIVRIY